MARVVGSPESWNNAERTLDWTMGLDSIMDSLIDCTLLCKYWWINCSSTAVYLHNVNCIQLHVQCIIAYRLSVAIQSRSNQFVSMWPIRWWLYYSRELQRWRGRFSVGHNKQVGRVCNTAQVALNIATIANAVTNQCSTPVVTVPSSGGSSVILVPRQPLPVVLPQQPQASRPAGVQTQSAGTGSVAARYQTLASSTTLSGIDLFRLFEVVHVS